MRKILLWSWMLFMCVCFFIGFADVIIFLADKLS